MRRISGVVLSLLLLGLVIPGPAAEAGEALVEARTIGWTPQHRPIRAFRLGDPASPKKVVLIGGIHGDETAPSRILLNLRDGRRIHGADIWVVPYFNRDGVALHRRKNARGVDLNRNFPYRWKALTGRYYSGSRPASEPETRYLMRFLDQVDPDFVVGFHQPLYGVDVYAGKTRGFSVVLARNLGLPRKTFNCNGVCHGTMTQWFNAKHAGRAVTVEYGRGLSRAQEFRGVRGLLLTFGAWR